MSPARIRNVMSVDVEDYYHVSAMEGVVSRDAWPTCESRVVDSTIRVLDLLAEHRVTATFFILGWVADRYPALVQRIVAAGHEIASHSYWHRLVYTLTPETFREDLHRAKVAIEDAAGIAVCGYRAPSYSITEKSLWALDVLIDEGYAYDSSIFPIRHDRYGIPSAPRQAHRITRNGGSLLELPATAGRVGSLAVAVGGGYFRILPYAWTRWGIGRLNDVERLPAIFYLHPWEIDPEQPRLRAPLLGRFRHYCNLAKTEERLRSLVREFRFSTMATLLHEQMLPVAPGSAVGTPPLPYEW
jgi:polysaccharide deacetylase family protein (PEP-CTERM system associated)